MGLPAQQNISIYKGDSFSFSFTLFQRDENGDPTTDPVDLTDAEAKAQIRSTEDSGAVMAEFDVEHDDEGGTVTLSLGPVATTALVSNGVWDVQLTYPDGTVKTYLHGNMSLVKEVTRV